MVQEVSTQSWGSRLLGSLIGILVGIFLIVASFYAVFWNEGHGLHTAQSLEQTEKVLISVPNTPIHTSNDLKVVYLSGQATTNNTLQDSLLGISITAIKLKRTVEMYQWQENKESQSNTQVGGSEQTTTTYHYQPVWSEKLIDSTRFKDQNGHQNPASMPFESISQYAKQVTVGDFYLPHDLIKQINNKTPMDLSTLNLAGVQAIVKQPVQHSGNDIYIGNNPQSPQVGDVRVSVYTVQPQTVSIIAQQIGNSFQAYMAPAGIPISILVTGQQSPQEMIHNAQLENTMMIWIIRLVTLILMMVGIGLILRP
jgi:hypothetical protein